MKLKYIMNFYDFINEGVLISTSNNISFNYRVDADEHFYDRLYREDGLPDVNGEILINEEEVLDDISKASKIIASQNLFNNGIFWKGDNLNLDILITNKNTFLNTVLMVNKIKHNYIFTIKTVMRKKIFSFKEKETYQILI
jgi:hypothetical protein